jgi:hypothetical protein
MARDLEHGCAHLTGFGRENGGGAIRRHFACAKII